MDLAIEEKKLTIIAKKNEVRLLEQELKILEMKAQVQSSTKPTSFEDDERQVHRKLDENIVSEKQRNHSGLLPIDSRIAKKLKTGLPSTTQIHNTVILPTPKASLPIIKSSNSILRPRGFNPSSALVETPKASFPIIIKTTSILRPRGFNPSSALETPKASFPIIKGTSILRPRGFNPSSALEIQSQLCKKTLSFEEWKELYAEMKTYSAISSRFLPVIRNGHVKAMALEDINPNMFTELFAAGLIDTVYPGNELKEFSFMPKLKQALSIYLERSKIKVQEKCMFVKVISSVPDWEEEGYDFPAHHLLKIGPACSSFSYPDPVKLKIEDEVTPDVMMIRRMDGYYFMLKELQRITEKSQIKVNYSTANVLVLSKFYKKIQSEDLARIRSFEEDIIKRRIQVSTATKEKMRELVVEDEDTINEDKMSTKADMMSTKSRYDVD